MRRTTTRRAASTGLGALAATTALALAAPSASAATSEIVLDPAAEEVFLSLSAYPTSSDLQESADYAPVPTSGEVTIALPSLARASGDLSAGVYELDAYEQAAGDDDLEPIATTETAPDDFTVAPGEDGASSVDVVLPVELFDDLQVDEVVVLVDGVQVDGFTEGPVLDFAVEATPSASSGRDDVVPLELAADLFAVAALEDTLEATAGAPFDLALPEESSFTALGVTSLEDAALSLYPLGDGDDFAWVSEVGTDAGAAVAASPSGAAAAAALAEGADAVTAVEAAAAAPVAATDADDIDYEDLEPDVEVSDDGRTAQVTPSADLPEGDYLLELLLPSTTDDAVLTVVFGDVELAAAAPEPTPTVTVTQPAPTTTVTAAPPRQNPGLRSNTGVEDAAPGLPDGGLVLLGSGMLAVAGATGAAAARSSRRARR
ncbi:hypothetical protein WDZ17_04655 [Pseudokineococcus basanitobsidens]|uniref:DUF4397 domain-containing protein n=1 Tax=Pseudokineococcus basanitobsidens TaxID=1926649 RepID=A0ABU8RHU9_9ACTN